MRSTLLAALLASGLAMPALADPLRLNQASAAELASIDGVDDALAMRIVDLREERGRLGSVEALRVLDPDAKALDSLRREVIIDLAVVASQGKKRFTKPDEVLAQFASEPDVRAVQSMAMSYTRTNPSLVDGWLKSSRSAFLLPKLNLQYEKKLDLNQDYEYLKNDDGDLEEELDGADTDNNDKYVVKLEWKLDKLVMSSERIRVINETQDVVKLRDKVLDEVTRLYFDRRRLQVDTLLNPSGDLRTQLETELRLQELTANIDALTGGAFSAAVN